MYASESIGQGRHIRESADSCLPASKKLSEEQLSTQPASNLATILNAAVSYVYRVARVAEPHSRKALKTAHAK